MMSELTRLHDEALRLLTTYDEHKNSDDEKLRRKVHIDLDHFLMRHRDVAAIFFVEGLQREIACLVAEEQQPPARVPWYARLLTKYRKGGYINASNKNLESES